MSRRSCRRSPGSHPLAWPIPGVARLESFALQSVGEGMSSVPVVASNDGDALAVGGAACDLAP